MKLIRVCTGVGLGAVATALGIVLLIFGVPFAIGIGLDLVDLIGEPLVRGSLWCMFAVTFCMAAIWALRRRASAAHRA